jgi:hypothetical protein
VYVLVKKAGYGASAIKVPLAEIIRPEAKTATVLDKGVVPEGELNPWDVARKLEQQVVYYTKKYQGYVPQALAQFPSIPREEFERLVLHASRVAPDYPTVQAARFYYELENGRPDEAKKYHRFIKEDAIYIKQVYGMIWETGLRMRW